MSYAVKIAATLTVLSACVSLPAAADYASDLRAFFEHVDETYPFFELKGIRGTWAAAKERLEIEVESCENDEAFMEIVRDAIAALHDAHIAVTDSGVQPRPFPKRYYPGISFLPASENRVVVMWAQDAYGKALIPGTIVTEIDGRDARTFLDDAARSEWDAGFVSSPQRAAVFAYRIPLKDERGATHTITYLDGDGQESLTVTCDMEVRGWPHTYNLPDGMKRVGRSFWYTDLRDNVGYMYWRRVDGSIVEGMDAAVAAHPAMRGWIVDLRGNGGGGYDDELINRIKSLSRPIAVIIDAGCVSAGETVARDFRRYADATLYGSRTGGSSSSKYQWTFPSGIATLRLPSRSRWRADGEPIEFNGIEPDVVVETEPVDVREGRNTAIERAVDGILDVKALPIRRPPG